MEKQKKYYVFISYKSEDVEWAMWLQHELEHYHLPTSYNGRTDLRPVFRDTDELAAGNLPEQIQQALDDSANLIVICSPKSAQSTWVNQEVETFIKQGKTNRIFPFIVEGKPYADSIDKECFPKALRNLPKHEERLGGDAIKQGRDIAFVKIVAGMLGVGFDSLWNRYGKEKAEQERKEREEKKKLQVVQSLLIAERANGLIEKGDCYKAAILSLKALPNSDNPDWPLTREAETVLRKAMEVESTILSHSTIFIHIYSFSNDGRFLTSISDNLLCVWDLYKGVLVYSEEQIHTITAALYEKENSLLISAYSNTQANAGVDEKFYIKILNTENNKCGSLKGHTSFINSLSLSLSQRYVLSASEDKTVKLWKVDATQDVTTFEGHRKAVNTAIFTKDEKFIVSSSEDKTIRIWDINTSKTVRILKGHKKAVNHVSLSSDGNLLVSASEDRTVRVWDFGTGACKKILEGHSDAVDYAFFSVDDNHIISVSADETVRIWNLEDDEVIIKNVGNLTRHESLSGKRNREFDMLYSASSRVLSNMSLFHDLFKISPISCIRLFFHRIFGLTSRNADVSRKFLKKLQYKQDYICLGPNGERMATTIGANGIRIVKSRTLIDSSRTLIDSWADTINLNIPIGYLGSVRCASFCSPGNYVALIHIGEIRIYDTSTGSVVKSLTTKDNEDTVFYNVAFSPNGNYVAATSMDQKLRIWNLETEEYIRLPHRSRFPHHIAFSIDSSYLVAPSFDGDMNIWDVSSGICVKTIMVHNGIIRYVSFSPDSRYVLSISDGEIIKVWDIYKGECIKKLRGHKAKVIYAIFCPNPDIKNILSISEDKTIRIWDWHNEKCVTVIEENNVDNASWITYNYHGDSFISISNNYIKIWNVSNCECIKTIKIEKGSAGVWFDGETIISVTHFTYQIHKWYFPTLQKLISETHKRFKDNPLSEEELKQFFIE